MRIGYIGLGALGSELARCFVAGHELAVWDLNDRAAAPLARAGAHVAPSAAELAKRSDVILLCLPRSADVRELIFGHRGLVEGLSPGQLVIDQTSGVPKETAETAARLAARGVVMMDAAVSASPHVVAQGAATLMAAAPDDVYERALPVLRAITAKIHRCGTRVGDGQAMKIVNNAMNAACRLGTLEVVAMGRKAGLSLAAMTATLNAGRGCNQTTEKMLPAIARGEASTNFALSLMLKDVNQAAALGMEQGVPMPITGIVCSLLQIGVNTIGTQAKLEDMVGLTETMAATRFMDSSTGAAPDEDAADTLPTIDAAVAALGQLVTYECVAAGFRHGLSLPDMTRILHGTSGWSHASREVLAQLNADTRVSSEQFGPMAASLATAAELGLRLGAPMPISCAVRGVAESALHGSAIQSFGD
nr:NAD(P)-binding domain-containing protein [Variovorax guangxiensis]